MKKATYLKTVKAGFGITQKLYRLDPPLEESSFLNDKVVTSHQHVIVSAAKHGEGMFQIHETYIFPASAEGEVTGWGELPGSIKGTTSHEEALREAGYEVIE